MRTRELLAITVVTIGSLPWMPTAGAQSSGKGEPCTIEVEVEFSPGISTTPGSGTITSNGMTGKGRCGNFEPFSYGVVGRYGTDRLMSCTSAGGGEGTQTVRDSKSEQSEDMTFQLTGQEDDAVRGMIEADRLSGPFEARLVEGDCSSEPVTKVHVTIFADY